MAAPSNIAKIIVVISNSYKLFQLSYQVTALSNIAMIIFFSNYVIMLSQFFY